MSPLECIERADYLEGKSLEPISPRMRQDYHRMSISWRTLALQTSQLREIESFVDARASL